MRFFDLMRGALTAAPTSDEPVSQMPQAAPTTEKPRPNAMPMYPHPYGLMFDNTSERHCCKGPTCTTCAR